MVARPETDTDSSQASAPRKQRSALSALLLAWRRLLSGGGGTLSVDDVLGPLRRALQRSLAAFSDALASVGRAASAVLARVGGGARRLVGSIAPALKAVAREPAACIRALSSCARTPDACAESPPDVRRVAVAGGFAVLVGALGTAALGGWLSWTATPALWMVGWAALRLALLRIASEDSRPETVRRTTLAWSAGLLPYAFALTGTLQAAAFAVSLLLGARTLRATGVETATRRRMITWAYGGELAVAVVSWVLSGGAALLAIRG